jgi:DNA transformation protein
MAVSSDYREFVLDQLADLPGLASRRMFGGVGLYADGLFFGLIDDDVLYLKVDDTNRGDFEQRGMDRFRPYADRPEESMSYYVVPADVLEDAETLCAWARRSMGVALVARRPTRPRRPRR